MSEATHPNMVPVVARGRASQVNPPNRFERLHVTVLGEALDEERAEAPDGRQVKAELFRGNASSVLNRIDSPDLPFDWTFNPYRGCEHGCAYCYARPTHETLGFSCGLDFETKIVVKDNAPELLRRAFMRPSWHGEPIAVAGVTDAYQPLERKLEVTRRSLAIFRDFLQPLTIVTKNRLVVRDIDLLGPLAEVGAARVGISITTLDPALSAEMEPRASAPRDRLRAVTELQAAGIPVIVMVAPVIPGLTDHEVPAILDAAAHAGASGASWTMLRLPRQVKDVFVEWLERTRPDRASHVLSAIREIRDGRLDESAFHARHRGKGARAEQIATMFDLFRQRAGLAGTFPKLSSASFQRPGDTMMLF